MGSIMFSNNIMKQCNMCNEIKPLSEYYKFSNKNNPERVYYQSYCKKCANKRRAENWRKQRAREREILAMSQRDRSERPKLDPSYYQDAPEHSRSSAEPESESTSSDSPTSSSSSQHSQE